MLGAGLFWVMQLHLAWVILPPIVFLSLGSHLLNLARLRQHGSGRAILTCVLCFLLGSTLAGSVLLPTYFKYGLVEGSGRIEAWVHLNPAILLNRENNAITIPARFLSFASFPLLRFTKGDAYHPYLVLRQQPWLVPLYGFLSVVSIVHPIALLFLWFSRKQEPRDWPAIKYASLLTVAVILAAFLFTWRRPHSPTYYVALPMAMMYNFYCLT